MTDWDRLNAAQLAAFGQAVTYQPASGGGSLEIEAVVHYGEDPEDARGGYVEARATVQVLESDVAAPAYGDTVTIGAESWTVLRRIGRSAGMWTLELRSNLRATLRRG